MLLTSHCKHELQIVNINFRSSPVTIDDTSHLVATLVHEVLTDSGNFPWHMTDSIVVLEDSYSEVIMNVIDLEL